MKGRTKLVFWLGALVFACVLGGWWYLVQKTMWDAKSLFDRARQLQVGSASVEEVLDLARSAPGKQYGFDPCLSGLGGCTGAIYVENTWLYRLHLAPRLGFGVRFGIAHNRLTNREFSMDVNGLYGAQTYGEVFVNERAAGPGRRPFSVEGMNFAVGVNMTTEAPEEKKNLAYSFNFHCLAQIGGCRSLEEMLPILKRKDITGPNPWMHTYVSH